MYNKDGWGQAGPFAFNNNGKCGNGNGLYSGDADQPQQFLDCFTGFIIDYS